jgi:hypothetical protein
MGSCSNKRPEISLALFPPYEHTMRSEQSAAKKKCCPEPDHADTLNLDLHIVYKPHGISLL